MVQIDPTLIERLRNAPEHEIFDVDVFLASDPVQDVIADRSAGVGDGGMEVTAETLEARAFQSQTNLLEYLGAQSAPGVFNDGLAQLPGVEIVGQFWCTNSVAVRVTPAVLTELMNRDDVVAIQPARFASWEELADDGPKESEAAAASETADVREADIPAAAARVARIPWSVARINAPLLWARHIDGTDVVVAVIDSGVNYLHDDLKGRMWQSPDFPKHGFDFDANDDDDARDPMDQSGHGTACAGIIAGDGTSGEKTGVAPGARIMALRVGTAERQHWSAMEFAMKQRVHVVSMSLSWSFPLSPDYPGWRRICASLNALGITHANSVGNDGATRRVSPIPFNVGAPANCPPPWLNPSSPIRGGRSSAVACGATDSSDALWTGSSSGPVEWKTPPYDDYPLNGDLRKGLIKPNVCAPGPGSRSCNWRFRLSNATRPYLSFGQTSAATPHVAGCMALLIHATLLAGKKPNPAEILEAMEMTAVRISGQTENKQNGYGAGRVDVYAAYRHGQRLGWW